MADLLPPSAPDASPPRYRVTLLERTGEMRVRAISRRRTTLVMMPPLAVYAVVVSLMPRLRDLAPTKSELVSFPLILMFGLTALLYVTSARRPLADFGLRNYGTGYAVRAGVLGAVPICLLAIVAKALWIAADPARADYPIFAAGTVAARYTPATYVAYIIGYGCFAIVQEFVARGVMQTALAELLPRPMRAATALVVANLFFAVTHLHISPAFTVASFVPGLYWGWLYHRHRHLAAPATNHAITGAFAYFVLDADLLR